MYPKIFSPPLFDILLHTPPPDNEPFDLREIAQFFSSVKKIFDPFPKSGQNRRFRITQSSVMLILCFFRKCRYFLWLYYKTFGINPLLECSGKKKGEEPDAWQIGSKIIEEGGNDKNATKFYKDRSIKPLANRDRKMPCSPISFCGQNAQKGRQSKHRKRKWKHLQDRSYACARKVSLRIVARKTPIFEIHLINAKTRLTRLFETQPTALYNSKKKPYGQPLTHPPSASRKMRISLSSPSRGAFSVK